MTIWNGLLNALYQVEKPISMTTSNRILLDVAMLSTLIVFLLTGFQPMQKVF